MESKVHQERRGDMFLQLFGSNLAQQMTSAEIGLLPLIYQLDSTATRRYNKQSNPVVSKPKMAVQ